MLLVNLIILLCKSFLLWEDYQQTQEAKEDINYKVNSH